MHSAVVNSNTRLRILMFILLSVTTISMNATRSFQEKKITPAVKFKKGTSHASNALDMLLFSVPLFAPPKRVV